MLIKILSLLIFSFQSSLFTGITFSVPLLDPSLQFLVMWSTWGLSPWALLCTCPFFDDLTSSYLFSWPFRLYPDDLHLYSQPRPLFWTPNSYAQLFNSLLKWVVSESGFLVSPFRCVPLPMVLISSNASLLTQFVGPQDESIHDSSLPFTPHTNKSYRFYL